MAGREIDNWVEGKPFSMGQSSSGRKMFELAKIRQFSLTMRKEEC